MSLKCNRAARMLAILLACAMFGSGCDRVREKPVYKIGYMNCNNEQETLARFRPLTAYLSEKLGVEFETVNVDTFDFEDRFTAEKFAFTHTNSILYIILKEHHDLRLLAAEKRGQFGTHTAGTIIARKDSGITSLAGIRGKRLVFGPMLAPTGYLAEYDLMLRNGIDPERDLAYWAIPDGSFKHEKVVYGVLFRKYDVGAAPILDLEVMAAEGKIDPEELVVLERSPLVPYCTFGAAADVDPQLVERFQQALLELTPESTAEVDGERVKVLKAAWIDGFEDLKDGDYDVIREMLRRVDMPPYQEF
jgi:phosphonate transport system substrate-binding protein